MLSTALAGTYTIERELGGGGMARVFVAEESALGRKVVLKVLPSEKSGGVPAKRFAREIWLSARLSHPHIVPLLSAGEAGGQPYYTMPLVDGKSLRERLADGPLPIPEALSLLRDVARALAYAHAHGVVHRDIKPENVLVVGGVAAVTDFGVAKAITAATANPAEEGGGSGTGGGLTSHGVALGTPAYMAPEQVAADPAVDHRADVYAWGVLAYELLAGRTPFAGRRAMAVMAANVNEAPEPIDRLRASTPKALATVVMRALAKPPADRPTAEELLHALDALSAPGEGARQSAAPGTPARPGFVATPGGGSVSPSPPPATRSGTPPSSSPAPPAAADVRRMLPAVAAAIVALIALVIAVVVFTRGGR
jgi:serine/threonine-protein kinase